MTLRTLALGVVLAVLFGGAVYWLSRERDLPTGPPSVGDLVCGSYATESDAAGRSTFLSLRSDGSCSLWPRHLEGQMWVEESEKRGRWSVSIEGALALNWEHSPDEQAAGFAVSEWGNVELRVAGQLFRELEPLCTY